MNNQLAEDSRIKRGNSRYWRFAELFLAALLWLMPVSATAVDVADYKWGFNGKVAPHRFNVLSVLFNNPTAQQFTGEVVLRKSLGAGAAAFIDASIIETVTISPNSQKWVQFYPYITSDVANGFVSENWSVKFPGGNYDFQTPRLAKYQRVILDDSTSVSAKSSGIKFHFADNLFPPYVTATDALQLVILDHLPRWEESRRQSFIDWLYIGGTVVVLHDNGGKFPEFSGPLAVLKTPLDEQLYGSGRIIHLHKNRSQFSEEDLLQVCAHLPKNFLTRNSTEKTDDVVDRLDETQQLHQIQNVGYSDSSDPFKAATFLSQLKEMTKPEHNWLLLHVMFWAYIGLVFPGCYLLGRWSSDFRVVYAGLLGTVLIFSLLFSYVGQRGYGESTAVHTVAVAKPLPDGFMDVTSWSNVFVTGGAIYDVRLNATGSLYSSCSDHEAVRGEINNGAEGLYRVDIPPFSNREIATRAKIPFNTLKLNVESVKSEEGGNIELEIEVHGLKKEEIEKQFALVGNIFSDLKWRNGKLVFGTELGSVPAVLRVQETRNQAYKYYPYGNREKISIGERYGKMFLPLLSRGLSVSREKEADGLQLPNGLIRVFLLVKAPTEFRIQNNLLSNQDGRVLYCITLSAAEIQSEPETGPP